MPLRYVRASRNISNPKGCVSIEYLTPRRVRGTQQTVSVNICSKGLLSPTIFGLKFAGKSGVVFSLNFNDMDKLIPVVFVLGRKKRPASIFGRQQ